MRYVSTKSILTDPYRAGLEIGAALAPISPEVILLFASMSYDPDFSDFSEALYDTLGTESVIVFGGTLLSEDFFTIACRNRRGDDLRQCRTGYCGAGLQRIPRRCYERGHGRHAGSDT